MLIVDAHIDIAYSALRYDRDVRLELDEVRKREAGRKPLPNGTITVTIPELRKGGVGLVCATLFVMPEADNRKTPDNRRLVYANSDEAYRAALQQLDYYRRLADELEHLRLVGDLDALEEVVNSHEESQEPLLGLVPLMEGGDPIRDPQELEEWYERGVRLIGPAWQDTRYAYGAWGDGAGFTKEGFELMEAMADLGFILDVTHLSEKATFEAFDRYEGPVVATHCNARALVPGQRQLSDDQIRRLAERDGVMGVVLHNPFLKGGYSRTDPKESVTLSHVVDHVDHVCQLLGDADHVGIGSDLDGGFGVEHAPAEIDGASDLPQITSALAERGFGEEEIAKVMGGNWLARLRSAL